MLSSSQGRNKEVNKFKNISYAMVAGLLADYFQVGITNFMHDFTNTDFAETERSASILASWVVVVSMTLMSEKTNLISASIFATGLTIIVIAVYNAVVNGQEIDFANIPKRFIIDSITIILLMFFYLQILEELKKYQKRKYTGPIAQVINRIIINFPIILYFAYRQFKLDLESAEKAEKNQKSIKNK